MVMSLRIQLALYSDSDNAFLLAAYSANGIPGRFFRILDYAYYSYANIEGRSRLNYDDIDFCLKK